ncbi:MAG: adenosylcobinamide-GDP ribazoletransferase [Gaiellaceae bacterium]
MPGPSGAGAGLRAGAAAVSFLTRVPVGRHLALDAADVGRGAALFPLVGAGIGAAVGLVAVGLDAVLPPFLAAALAVAVEALLTGAIHLDALADTADALGGGSRERALEIMREGTIGAFGGVALGLDLLVKTLALAALLEQPGTVLLAVAAWATGRAAPLALAWALPYARQTAGSGRVLTHVGGAHLAAGLALGVAIAVAAAGNRAPALLAAAAVAAVAVGLAARARFRGVTGDVLGAAAETVTVLALVGAVAAR